MNCPYRRVTTRTVGTQFPGNELVLVFPAEPTAQQAEASATAYVAVGIYLREQSGYINPRTGHSVVQALRAKFWWKAAAGRIVRLLHFRQRWSAHGRYLQEYPRHQLWDGLRRVNGQLRRIRPAVVRAPGYPRRGLVRDIADRQLVEEGP